LQDFISLEVLTFLGLYIKKVGDNIAIYNSYPRLVGETGGKDFHFVHESADVDNVVYHSIRGAFEYQGQKCSALSRMYVPENIWPQVRDGLVKTASQLKMGQADDFSSFMSAVIDKSSFDSIKGYIDFVKTSKDAEIICGGNCDASSGYFIQPTIVVTKDPKFKTMQEEIFGPVLTIYVYNPKKYVETLKLCDQTSPYSLTGSIFARDRAAINTAHDYLRNSAGNFYVNDKCTGAVVGQQPFGGARASGTNDKAGSALNLLRWVSARTIKESFIPISDYAYPHMKPEK